MRKLLIGAVAAVALLAGLSVTPAADAQGWRFRPRVQYNYYAPGAWQVNPYTGTYQWNRPYPGRYWTGRFRSPAMRPMIYDPYTGMWRYGYQSYQSYPYYTY
jgi:hypothetical protein